MRTFPFSAVVGSDDMALALVLTSISPEVGGVLVRGEKGTAKSTMVRALAAVQPDQLVVQGCRFSCDPADPDPACPDGPHTDIVAVRRPARLVELPVGATEDRVIGSLDLQQALGSGRVSYEPGLLAAAHRGILYVDEVNLLHDHLVDLLLDAAAMGRSTVERDGVSVAHAARLVLVGTMNPEEGELRPQLLDRFGLTVEVAAPRDPALRSEVVRRRLAYDADPAALVARFADQEETLRARLAAAQERLDRVQLSDWALTKIAAVCAGFEVDGMRADIVTARAAVAHAAWHDRSEVTRADIRAAARLALPHRRRRNPFDAPGLDEELLDRLLGDDDVQPEPEPPTDPPAPDPDDPAPEEPTPEDSTPEDTTPEDTEGPTTPPEGGETTRTTPDAADSIDPAESPDQTAEQSGEPAPASIAQAGQPYRARLLTVRGTGEGEAGRRSRALTSVGRTVGATATAGSRLHFPATVRAAAIEQQRRGRQAGDRLLFARGDLRTTVTEGRESNLVLFCVDASGSMAARKRMAEVKTAVLSLLLDAYQRRDKVGLVTFRGSGATLALPPTSSVEVAARRLEEVPSGGRTPLAEGLLCAADTLRWERIRDPRRRPLLVVVTDGRATAGADALLRARQAATYLNGMGTDAVVVDCESGRMSLGLAVGLAEDLQAQYVKLTEVDAGALAGVAAAGRDVGMATTSRPECGVKGEVENVPADGLTTRQRRNRPLLIVHTGDGKGKSTAAFGLALRGWNQGWPIGVFQFVKSAKWRIGEQTALETLAEVHATTGAGGPIEWHKMGSGWSWSRKTGSADDHAAAASEGWAEIKRRLAAETHTLYVLDEFTYPIAWGWIDVDDVVATLAERPGRQHVIITGRRADPKIIEIADLVTEMTKINHPFDQGQKGQRGIEW